MWENFVWLNHLKINLAFRHPLSTLSHLTSSMCIIFHFSFVTLSRTHFVHHSRPKVGALEENKSKPACRSEGSTLEKEEIRIQSTLEIYTTTPGERMEKRKKNSTNRLDSDCVCSIELFWNGRIKIEKKKIVLILFEYISVMFMNPLSE